MRPKASEAEYTESEYKDSVMIDTPTVGDIPFKDEIGLL